MFHTVFSMTNLHQASLPTVRAEFYAINQKEGESILKYTSRVDVIVATMAKLGERIPPGAWIYALGNGLRAEFRECKDGILYNKDGFGSVMSVKLRLISEEAVLTSQTKKAPTVPPPIKTIDDEIALVATTKRDLKKLTTPPTATTETPGDTSASPDTAFWMRGKGGKNDTKGKGRSKSKNRWVAHEHQWNHDWTQWSQPSKGKGRGKGEPFWCDICSRAGHSTDWCYDNPNRSGGKPLPYDELWCDTCNRSGHTSNTCYATSIKISPKGKGKTKGNKGMPGDRQWKSQNFPAAYHSEQATPALHEESSSTAVQVWWNDHELGSAILDGEPNPVPLHSSLLDDYVDMNHFDDDDD
jgi:hypothetical protein